MPITVLPRPFEVTSTLSPSPLAETLRSLELGKPHQYGALTVFPLLSDDDGPEYLMLSEALERKLLTITEISEGGSVPDLKVESRADLPILLIDGEELAGAKQNRAVNATILLRERAITIIPVSCTEQGRWRYTERAFQSSGKVMAKSVRAAKAYSVSHSLREEGTYRSDQGEVWSNISELHAQVGSASPTHAMRDAYSRVQPTLDRVTDTIPEPAARQRGSLVVVGNTVAGFDLLSRASAYRQVHRKLLESYAMDALVNKEAALSADSAERLATEFLGQALVAAAEAPSHPSIGYGEDVRFEGPGMTGSAIVHDGATIHVAAFGIADNPESASLDYQSNRMASRHQRASRQYSL